MRAPCMYERRCGVEMTALAARPGRPMSGQAGRNELPAARRRRLVGVGLLRSLITTVVLAGLYYLLPLDHITNVPLTLVGGLLILLAVTVWQRAIIRARYPALRAVEALATTVPLFLLLFASAYFTMATTSPANFSTLPHPHRCALPHRHHIQHRGVRDITAVSQSARLVVTAQKLVRH